MALQQPDRGRARQFLKRASSGGTDTETPLGAAVRVLENGAAVAHANRGQLLAYGSGLPEGLDWRRGRRGISRGA